jgi:hypothetical protein
LRPSSNQNQIYCVEAKADEVVTERECRGETLISRDPYISRAGAACVKLTFGTEPDTAANRN